MRFPRAVANRPILIRKGIGDQVIPNRATDRPLATGGIVANKANHAGPRPACFYVAFTARTHRSLLACLARRRW